MNNTQNKKQEQDLNEVLAERGNRYGDFGTHATITQMFKDMQRRHQQKPLTYVQQEALDMIFHKIGRIINGDPDYEDSWIDIAGYAQLVVEDMEKVKSMT